MTIHVHDAAEGAAQQFAVKALSQTMRVLVKPLFNPRTPLGVLRKGLIAASLTTLPARGATREDVTIAGIPAERWRPKGGANDKVVLYFHGGAYCAGAPRTHRSLASHLAVQSGATVIVPDYALAPEAPFPSAVDDALAAYKALLSEGVDASNIVIAGDSAGGGLSMACTLAARDDNQPLPSRLILLSPWVDLTLKQRQQVKGEVMLTWEGLERSAEHYAEDQRHAPLASPLLASHHGLPPCLIITGSNEILMGDSERLMKRLQAADVDVDLHVYQGMWHVFPIQAGLLRAANQAVEEMGRFVRG